MRAPSPPPAQAQAPDSHLLFPEKFPLPDFRELAELEWKISEANGVAMQKSEPRTQPWRGSAALAQHGQAGHVSTAPSHSHVPCPVLSLPCPHPLSFARNTCEHLLPKALWGHLSPGSTSRQSRFLGETWWLSTLQDAVHLNPPPWFPGGSPNVTFCSMEFH